MIEQLSVQAVTIVVGGAITDDDVAKTVCQVVVRVVMN